MGGGLERAATVASIITSRRCRLIYNRWRSHERWSHGETGLKEMLTHRSEVRSREKSARESIPERTGMMETVGAVGVECTTTKAMTKERYNAFISIGMTMVFVLL